MSNKTKIENSTVDQLGKIAGQAGLILMTAAVTLGMLELPEHGSRIVLPNQPAPAGENGEEKSNPIRREKEETGPHYISYTVAQRTPGRSGRS